MATGRKQGVVSIFEWFQNPSLSVVPDISISADGAVKSVRLFSKVPIEQIESVALDTSSLTSSALTKIVLSETYDVTPTYVDSPPNLNDMLSKCDAGLIIGDLGLFHSPVRKVLDLGSEWKNLTGMPFCYAAWLAQPGADLGKLHSILTAARAWGLQNVDSICTEWSVKMNLDIERVIDYLCTVMQYDLGPDKLSAVECFRDYCGKYGLMDR